MGHGRRTQFHHRCAHRLVRQRPDQHAPSPLRHHLSHRLRQREGSLTHLLQSRLRYPLPSVRPHAQSRHRLPIPYLTQRPTRRSTNIAIPIPQGLDEMGHGLPIPYLTQRPTRRSTNILIPIPQGLDEMGYSGSAYLHQRPTRRSTNIAIPIPQGLDEGGHCRHAHRAQCLYQLLSESLILAKHFGELLAQVVGAGRHAGEHGAEQLFAGVMHHLVLAPACEAQAHRVPLPLRAGDLDLHLHALPSHRVSPAPC
jgi:hypothetical protein